MESALLGVRAVIADIQGQYPDLELFERSVNTLYDLLKVTTRSISTNGCCLLTLYSRVDLVPSKCAWMLFPLFFFFKKHIHFRILLKVNHLFTLVLKWKLLTKCLLISTSSTKGPKFPFKERRRNNWNGFDL